MAALHVRISGRVQGVGFRLATEREARALSLSGWVRNLPDGQVEAYFEGPGETLALMRAWCHEGPALARVDDVTILPHELHQGAAPAGFAIRYW